MSKKLPVRRPKSKAVLFSRRRLYLALAAATQLALPSLAQAGPEDGTVVGGSGSIDQSGAATAISQTSDRLAINWDSFNIDANESVTFIQPDASSIALNPIHMVRL